VHGERRRKQPEGLDRDVLLQVGDSGLRIVAESNATGDFLEVRAQRRPDFLERRLERGSRLAPARSEPTMR
jgi:hypothetical protein